MPINAKLVVVGGEVKTAEIKLRLPSTIGRGRGCTIMLPQALVSRQHCEIFESEGKLMVRDLGSLNGTFVNNQKIAEPSPVNSEELLTIGTVTFRVVYEGAGASSPPAGPGPVMKSSVKEALPVAKAVPLPAASPITEPIAPADPDDNSQPLEIGDFEFEDTVRPSSDTVSPAPAIPKSPAAPFAMPAINIGDPAKKPAVPVAPAVVAAKAKSVAVAPAPAAPAKPVPAPAAKPIAPIAAPSPASAAKPAANASEGEEKAEEEDDFQDFLKSLGK